MLICDTHADTLWNMAWAERPADLPYDITKDYLTACEGTRVQALALFVATGGMQENPTIVERELAAFEQLKREGWHQITELDQAIPGEANMLLTIEGCEAFGGNPDNVDRFADLGVRVAALTWNNPNGLCTPACDSAEGGLTPLGRETVRRMRQRRIAVDVSHLNEAGFYDLLDGTVPPMASHSCARALCNHTRNLTDDQLRQLFRAGGFVGVNFYNTFLSEDHAADVNRVVDHMAYMCDLGGENHIGFGSDFDGIDEWPDGLRNAGDIPNLISAMRRRGFGDALVEKIAGLNFKAYMERI
ncbi:MAG: membrane dipeptidase [Clostridia bacterium]|nr:membrane dipeptidase [Clostridia bacterium]